MCVCVSARALSLAVCAVLLHLLSLLRERARRVLLHEIAFVVHLVLVLVFAIHGGRHRRTTLYPIAGHTNSDVAASKACQHRVKHVRSK